MAEGAQQFGNIQLGTRGGAVSGCCPACWAAASRTARPLVTIRTFWALLQTQGSLRVTQDGLVWKRSGGGRTVEVPADGETPPPFRLTAPWYSAPWHCNAAQQSPPQAK